jgi:GH24 family phage-related lysozyme (muramidase)
MLLVDGDFGPGTRDAVIDARQTLNKPGPPEADDELQAAISAVPDPFPFLTAAGVTFIARAEVSNATAYRRTYRTPCWPGKRSGITIGIGYDCQFVGPKKLKADWGDVLSVDMLAKLTATTRKVGSKALLTACAGVDVPLPVAMHVFATRTLPEYVDQTRNIYPQLDALIPARRTALVSLVYNRGASLKNDDSRSEMRSIRDLLAAGDLDGVDDELDSMTRLWDEATQRGLIQRRRDEARLWRSGFAALQLE